MLAQKKGAKAVLATLWKVADEGTSMFKMAATPADLPAQGTFVPLNIDGQNLPSDWYLRLADQAGRMLRGDIPLQPTIPIVP